LNPESIPSAMPVVAHALGHAGEVKLLAAEK
jgi:hypothetical protein